MRLRYRNSFGGLVSGLLTCLAGLIVVGCDEPDIVPVSPPGAPPPKVSPDVEPAAAKGEMPAAAGLEGTTTAKAEPYEPALPTAKGQTRTTKRGVTYETLKEGNGPELKYGQTGQFLYEGKLENGKVFDSTKSTGKPLEFQVGAGLIGGWQEGLPGMKVGETRKLIIPPVLGYGSRGTPDGKVPADATLYFEVELVGIKGQ
jgi:FKBP-type peptidyl-prolyl cis-trans isomerase